MTTFFMETTRINPQRTVSEIQSILAMNGAEAIVLEYKNKQVEAISFRIQIEGQTVPFRLPCKWDKLQQALKNKGARCRSDDTYEMFSRRVAWRQILRWVEAQMALIQTEMVTIDEVFLPYAQNNLGETIYDSIKKIGFNGLCLENKQS